jgi:predicted DNA-binding transcriptional regulator
MKGKIKKTNMDKLPVYQMVVEDNDDIGISRIILEFEISEAECQTQK